MRVSIANSLGLLTLLLALQAHGAGAPAPAKPAPKPPAKPVATYPFTLDTLLEDAKRRSAAPYAPQRNSAPSALDKLSPEQYRSIHFNPDAGIWREDKLPFRLELLRAAPNLSTPVTISTVENGVAKDLTATPAMFQMSGSIPAQLSRVSLPLSGFRIRSRINSPKVWDEFLVFQGASYFRAVAKNLLYGLSARGLAINTGEPAGEEFPVFTHFWIERPAQRANSLVIYALLESASATGTYKFTVTPGVDTHTEVELTLFPRKEIRVVGIAPLTSMFLFDETNRGRLDDYRPEVHDSDGLQITTKSGEQLFRPLANPLKLQVSAFTTQVPQGFGLVQRSRQQNDFQDIDMQYERRPSAWVTPKGDWGDGAVELVEIPSGRETNDNIVAFWRPTQPLTAGHPAHYAYDITWNDEPPLPKGLGKVVATRSGASLDRKRRVFMLDIVGAGEKLDGLRLELSSSAGAISNSTLVSNGSLHGLRASFELDPKDADLIELRVRIMRGDNPASETWLYRWTSS
ncbi:MAG TPA: glucan biosynthesis protein [Steroidobacteraceae bacterium]|nr:glucan biosynthesis protein [Steroidobacteraceae bacterium]